jgi:hypothetical protein
VNLGSRARICTHPVTDKLDLAGRVGVIHGWTTPSSTGVKVVGEPIEDFAIAVYFEELCEEYWFDEGLLEILDNGAGTFISIGDSELEYVLTESGEWESRPKTNNP